MSKKLLLLALIPLGATACKPNVSTPTVTTAPPTATSLSPTSISVPVIVEGLVMLITPHYNGDILLSKIAVNQNPSFFGFPFTGHTTPKLASNPTYPQRDPDPVVNIYVYDSSDALVKTELKYSLNTVYYELKSEIRITITPDILSGLSSSGSTDYPILVMSISEDPSCNYDLIFYSYGSTAYNSYLLLCDQSLPSGGKAISRKMGWF